METYIVSLSWSGYGLYLFRPKDGMFGKIRKDCSRRLGELLGRFQSKYYDPTIEMEKEVPIKDDMLEDPKIREAAIAAVSDYDRFEEFLLLKNEILFKYDDSETDTTFEEERNYLSKGIVSDHLITLLGEQLLGELVCPKLQIGVKYLKIMGPLTRDFDFPCTYDPFIGFLIDAAELHFERGVNYWMHYDEIGKRLEEEEEEKKKKMMMMMTEEDEQKIWEEEEKEKRLNKDVGVAMRELEEKILNIYNAEKEEKEKRKEMKRMKKMMNKEKMKLIRKNKKMMPWLMTEEEANKKKKRVMKAEEKRRLINDYEEEKKRVTEEWEEDLKMTFLASLHRSESERKMEKKKKKRLLTKKEEEKKMTTKAEEKKTKKKRLLMKEDEEKKMTTKAEEEKKTKKKRVRTR